MTCVTFTACGDDDEPYSTPAPTPVSDDPEKNTTDPVVTGNATDVDYTSVTICGYVNNDDPQAILEMGIAYGTDENASNGGRVTASQFDPGTNSRRFTVKINGLWPGRTYYYYAFAGQKTANKILTFATKDFDPSRAVDLGLSVKWAEGNIHADGLPCYSPYSDYWACFRWGETVSDYAINIYNQGDKNYYVGPQSSQNKNVLDLSDDAAHVRWGGNWRMPTVEEAQELIDNTTQEFVYSEKGQERGIKFISKKNGNYIFLPRQERYYIDAYGGPGYSYWCSTRYHEGGSRGAMFYAHGAGDGFHCGDAPYRGSGDQTSNSFLLIRPVCE